MTNEELIYIDEEIIEVEMEESPITFGGSERNHATLVNRDAADQHTIGAITGLESELENIKAVKPTVYSTGKNHANYYAWADGASTGAGYFITFADTYHTIKRCNDVSEVIGVSVDTAGFASGQAKDAEGNDCGLVVHSGLVKVFCESSVAVGDYVVSNKDGMATKSSGNYGYKVVAKDNTDTIHSADIILDISAEQIHRMGGAVSTLQSEMDSVEMNIGSIMSRLSLIDGDWSSAEAPPENIGPSVSDRLEEVEGAIGNIETTVNDAIRIADDAAKKAEEMRKDAVQAANDANATVEDLMKQFEPWVDEETGTVNREGVIEDLNKDGLLTDIAFKAVETDLEDAYTAIERSAKQIQSIAATIDNHSVGEFSQSYGLTHEQATSILDAGMIYVPSVDHEEEFDSEKYRFSEAHHYTWGTSADGIVGWLESESEDVMQSSNYVAGTATLKYWLATADVVNGEDTYTKGTLYKWEDSAWMAVATIAGNATNRMVSMVRQTANEVAAEVVSVRGDFASLSARVTDTEASASLVASKLLKDGEIHAAAITAAVNEAGSEATINADRIVLKGDTFFVGEDGKATTIDGSNITAGSITAEQIRANSITADKIDATELEVDAANIRGTIIANHMDATSGKVGGFNITDDAVVKKGMGMNSNDDVWAKSLLAVGEEKEFSTTMYPNTNENGVCEVTGHVFTLDDVGTDYVITDLHVNPISNLGSTVTLDDYSFSDNKISFTASTGRNVEEPLTTSITFKYMATSNVSPIRFFAGAQAVRRRVTYVWPNCITNEAGYYEVSGTLSLPVVGMEYTDAVVINVFTDKAGNGSSSETLTIDGNTFSLYLHNYSANDSIQVSAIIEYMPTGDIGASANSNFLVLDDGSTYAKAISIEGNSNIGGIYVDAKNGLFNNSEFSSSQCGILSNSNYFGYHTLTIDDDNSRIFPDGSSSIYLFGGQNEDGLLSGSLLESTNTTRCNFYVTQSGFVNARSILCDGGVVGIRSDSYHIAMHQGQVVIVDTRPTATNSGLTTEYSLLGTRWKYDNEEFAKINAAGNGGNFISVTGDWRFSNLQVGSQSSTGNVLIEQSQMYVQNNSNMYIKDNSNMYIQENSNMYVQDGSNLHVQNNGTVYIGDGDGIYSTSTSKLYVLAYGYLGDAEEQKEAREAASKRLTMVKHGEKDVPYVDVAKELNYLRAVLIKNKLDMDITEVNI